MKKSSKKPAFIFVSMLIIVFVLSAACFKKQDRDITGAGEPVFTLSGRVIDIDNGRVVKDAVVWIESLGIIDTVDAEGNYSLTGIKVGNRVVTVTAPLYAKKNTEIEFKYENQDVVNDMNMLKALIVEDKFQVPIKSLSGIWCEDNRLYVSSYDSTGGFIYKLDENLNIVRTSSHFGTLETEPWLWRVDTCFWKDDSCYAFMDPDSIFEPDSLKIDSIFVNPEQRLFGLAKIGDYLYAGDGMGIFIKKKYIPLTSFHFFVVDPNTLELVDTIRFSLFAFGYIRYQIINDLAWDGQAIWLNNRMEHNFPKIRMDTFTAQSILPAPNASPTGIAYDGKYIWMMTTTKLYQLERNMTVRNRYAFFDFYLYQIAWDGEHIWALEPAMQRIYKLSFPFEDHL